MSEAIGSKERKAYETGRAKMKHSSSLLWVEFLVHSKKIILLWPNSNGKYN